VTAALLDQGHDVTVLDDLSSGYRELVPDGARLLVGSVADSDDLERAFAGEPEYVLHFAALFANQNSVDHPARDLEVNAAGTLSVLERSLATGVRKVLNVSSSCVYGDAEVMRESETALRPHTPYAISKLFAEHYCTFFAEHHGLDVVSVRPFNVYGPNEYPGRYRNVIPNFFARALRGEPLTITGTGDETRDFTFNADLVAGVLAAVAAPTEPGAVFNLGSGRETRIADLAALINDIAGNDAGVELVPPRDWDHVARRRADVSRATAAFGYEAPTRIEEGLRRTHAWLASAVA
jgi:nucleoside-diphosphate-sugar epimerase